MISVVIPNYNGEQNLVENLPVLINSIENHDIEIIIVDDFSSDNSVSVINKFIKNHPKIHTVLMQNEKNRGFAPTVNIGVSKSRGELVVLLNTDVAPRPGFIEPALEDFQDADVFAVGFMDESIESGKVVLRGRGIGEWKKGFLIHSRGELDRRDSLWASGGSSMFRKSYWDKLSGLDEIYAPFYWEDIDISYRALKSGYKVIFEKKSIVVHKHEKGSIRKYYSKNQVKKIAYRNQFIFAWKNASATLVFLNIIWMPYFMLRSLLAFDFPFFLGFSNALLLTPQIFQRRFNQRRSFKRGDREVELKA